MTLRLLRDLVRYAPGQFAPILVALLSTAIFTRIASPEAYGTFVLVTALSTTITSPFGQWLMQGVLRFYPGAARNGHAPELVQAVSILALIFGAVIAGLVVLVLYLGLGSEGLRPVDLIPAGLMTFFGVAGAAPQAAMVARFASGRYSIITAVAAVSRLVLPLLAFPLLGPVPALLWGSAAATMLVWAFLTWDQVRNSAHVRVGFGEVRRISREAVAYGLPLAISEIGVQTLAYSDRYAIALILGAGAVGLYSTNYSIAEKLIIVVQAPMIYAAHSQIVSSWEHGQHADTERMIRNATRWLMILGLPLVALTLVRSEMISAVLLGEAFVPGHNVMPVIALSILVYACSQYGHKSFELSKDTWVIAASLLSAATANAIAVVVLISRIGYMGGAIATLFGYTAYAGVTYVISRRRGPFRWDIPWRTLLNVTLAGGAAAAVWAELMPDRLSSVWSGGGIVIAGCLGLGVYGLVLMLLNELPRDLRPAQLSSQLSALFGAHRGSISGTP